MDELKKSLKALDPQVKLIIWGGLGVACFVLFGVLDIVVGTTGFKMLGDASDLPYGSILLIVATICALVLPPATVALSLMKKKIVAKPAYIFAAVAFFFILFFDFKQVAGIYWLTFVISLIWAFLGYMLNNEKIDFTATK